MTTACQQLETLVRKNVESHLTSASSEKAAEKRSGDRSCAYKYVSGDLGLWIYLADGEINIVIDSSSEFDDETECSGMPQEDRTFLITAASYLEDYPSLGLSPIGKASSKSLDEQAKFMGTLLVKYLPRVEEEFRGGNGKEFMSKVEAQSSKRKVLKRKRINHLL